MRNLVAQIIIGTLIVAAASYTTWWMFTKIPTLARVTMGSNERFFVEYYPVQNSFYFFRAASIVIVVLAAVSTIMNSLVSSKRITSPNMVFIPMICGVLLVVLGILIFFYGLEPEYDFSNIPVKTEQLSPPFEIINRYAMVKPYYAMSGNIITCLFGTVSVMISTVQFLELKKRNLSLGESYGT